MKQTEEEFYAKLWRAKCKEMIELKKFLEKQDIFVYQERLDGPWKRR